MRRIVWARDARTDLLGIRAYIKQFNPHAANRMATSLVDAADSLAHSAERGRPVTGGRRELATIWPYLIRYRIDGDTVYILRMRHGARRTEGGK